MWEKIKGFFKDSGNAILLLLAAILSAVIYGMKRRLDKSEYTSGQLKADKNLAEVITKKEEAQREADTEQSEYERVRDAFEHNNDGGGDHNPK